MSSNPHKPRVFSGVQPTGDLHLGNYLRVLMNRMVEIKELLSLKLLCKKLIILEMI